MLLLLVWALRVVELLMFELLWVSGVSASETLTPSFSWFLSVYHFYVNKCYSLLNVVFQQLFLVVLVPFFQGLG